MKGRKKQRSGAGAQASILTMFSRMEDSRRPKQKEPQESATHENAGAGSSVVDEAATRNAASPTILSVSSDDQENASLVIDENAVQPASPRRSTSPLQPKENEPNVPRLSPRPASAPVIPAKRPPKLFPIFVPRKKQATTAPDPDDEDDSSTKDADESGQLPVVVNQPPSPAGDSRSLRDVLNDSFRNNAEDHYASSSFQSSQEGPPPSSSPNDSARSTQAGPPSTPPPSSPDPSNPNIGTMGDPIPVEESFLQARSPRTIDVDNDIDTDDDAIIISSSPIKLKAKPEVKPPRPTHPFFAPRQAKPTRPPRIRSPTKPAGEPSEAPWPASNTQHVRGPQTNFTSSTCGVLPLPQRHEDQSNTRFSDSEALPRDPLSKTLLKREDTYLHTRRKIQLLESQEHYEEKVNQIPDVHRAYPALSRFPTELPSRPRSNGQSSQQELWSEKWRPHRANEVLGNEWAAEYLKAWLLALALEVNILPEPAPKPSQLKSELDFRSNLKRSTGKAKAKSNKAEAGKKRPQVIRSVTKGRGKRRRIDSDDEDSWIVEDDEVDDDPISEVADDIDEERETPVVGVESDNPQPLTRLLRARPLTPSPEESPGQTIVQGSNSTLSGSHPGTTPSYDFSARLTNTLLLSGPSGSGKTASVYACAQELGWEVFEVYPGIGRRAGSNLMSLVGDVSKNHLIGQAPIRSSKSKPLDIFSAQCTDESDNIVYGIGSAAAEQPMDEQDPSHQDAHASERSAKINSDDLCIPSTSSADLTHSSVGPPPRDSDGREVGVRSATSHQPRQSIILLEEVDILYNEDVNFWPTVINLIRTSRRPVIMTCNDPSLVPIGELPLQTELVFCPPPTPLATSYLQRLALSEGYSTNEDDTAALYERPPDQVEDLEGGLFPSYRYDTAPRLDLRRALNGLQLMCQSALEPVGPSTDGVTGEVELAHDQKAVKECLTDWPRSSVQFLSRGTATWGTEPENRSLRRLANFVEAASYLDCHLEPRASALQEAFAWDDSASPQDSEVGHAVLGQPFSDFQAKSAGVAYFRKDHEIAFGFLDLATQPLESEAGRLRTAGDSAITGQANAVGGRLQARRIREALQSVMVATSARGAAADYEPWVRAMVLSDDAQEAEAAVLAAGRGGRATRNSQRAGYVRWVALGPGGLATLRDSAFRVDAMEHVGAAAGAGDQQPVHEPR